MLEDSETFFICFSTAFNRSQAQRHGRAWSRLGPAGTFSSACQLLIRGLLTSTCKSKRNALLFIGSARPVALDVCQSGIGLRYSHRTLDGLALDPHGPLASRPSHEVLRTALSRASEAAAALQPPCPAPKRQRRLHNSSCAAPYHRRPLCLAPAGYDAGSSITSSRSFGNPFNQRDRNVCRRLTRGGSGHRAARASSFRGALLRALGPHSLGCQPTGTHFHALLPFPCARL